MTTSFLKIYEYCQNLDFTSFCKVDGDGSDRQRRRSGRLLIEESGPVPSSIRLLPRRHPHATRHRFSVIMAPRRGGFRGGFSRWDRRDVGLKPENALSRAERTYISPTSP